MSALRWKVGKVVNGKRTVRTRTNGILIGEIKYAPFPGFYGVRPTGQKKFFTRRFDACAWLMDFFDAQQSIGGKQAC